jgi:hypothetical protein
VNPLNAPKVTTPEALVTRSPRIGRQLLTAA